MKLTEIKILREAEQGDVLEIIEILRILGLASDEYTISVEQDKYKIVTFTKIAFNDNIKYQLKDGSLPFQIAICDRDVSVIELPIKDCKNFPLHALAGVFVQYCPELISLEGITPKIEGSLILNDLPKIKSLVGIHEHFEYIKGEFIFNPDKIKEGGLGLMLIPKLTSFRAYGSMIFNEPFRIIHKYVGRPGDIFECQAELIAAGFEEYAQL